MSPTPSAKSSRLRAVRPALLRTVMIIILLAIQPWLWQRVATHTATSYAQRAHTQQLETISHRLDELKRLEYQQRPLLDPLKIVVPPLASLPLVIERVERLASENNVSVKIGDIKEQVLDEESLEPPQLQPIRLALQSTGTPAALLRFLEGLEHTQELAAIESWSLEPIAVASPLPGAPPVATSYTLNISLLFYFSRNL